jgi:hypothetical protein
MALVLADRVQETTTTSGTGSVTLAGAVSGFQTFAVIGNGNTCYYTIVDGNAWEVGIGTYSTTGPTLARTTVLSNSSGNTSAITLSGGTSSVFVTYPSEKSVNLDASDNASPLGTIASGTWQGTTIGVAYGGTGVTTSSGANSVMLRDANQNVAVNRLNQANTSVAAAGGTTNLTAASTYSQTLTGTGNQNFQMPDATTLATGVAFVFNNNATGTLTLLNNASATIGVIPSGGAVSLILLVNSTAAGTWDYHGFVPENIQWGTNSLYLASDIITGGTWNGGTITSGFGGTGLTTFTGANNALYSTSASALVAGTLPVAAGGTGVASSSGASSVMLRDANQNVAVNRLNQSNASTASAGGTTTLTAASSYSQTLTGTLAQTYIMPDATTLTGGVAFVFNNNSTGTLTLQNYATATIGTITSGGAVELVLLDNSTAAGTWDVHGYLPENVTWGTNALALGSTVITGGTWNGGTVTSAYGGTGLTTFTAANNALYSTAAGTLTAGTLPVLAGGTGVTTPAIVAGTSIAVTGTWPNQTISSIVRVVVIADGTTVTINADTTDVATQANTQTAGTLTINAPTGTPANGQKFIFRLLSTNVQTLSWNAAFQGSNDTPLPASSTGTSKYDYFGFIWNSTNSKWQMLAKNLGY